MMHLGKSSRVPCANEDMSTKDFKTAKKWIITSSSAEVAHTRFAACEIMGSLFRMKVSGFLQHSEFIKAKWDHTSWCQGRCSKLMTFFLRIILNGTKAKMDYLPQ